MADLSAFDFGVIEDWVQRGAVPENRSSREYAVKVIGKLNRDLAEMHDLVDRLLAADRKRVPTTESDDA